MGQHVTIHGKTFESFNGQDGKWIPLRTNTDGELMIALLQGELQQFNRMAGGAIAQYTQSTTATTTVIKMTPAIFYGIYVVTGAATSTVTVYDNASAGSGTKLVDTASTATSNTFIPALPGMGVLTNNGLTIVTATANAVIMVLWA